MQQCHHIRIRDTNDYNIDVESFIKAAEKKYNVDIRTLPMWKDLVQRLHAPKTDCENKIRNANLRKLSIINKLFVQFTRPSPFDLTDNLARTALKWKTMKSKRYASRKDSAVKTEEIDEATKSSLTFPHFNSEVTGQNFETETSLSKVTEIESKIPVDVETETDLMISKANLPLFITTNQHKLLSDLSSEEKMFSLKSCSIEPSHGSVEKQPLLKQTTMALSIPKKINVEAAYLCKEHCIKFSILNCVAEYLHLRFIRVTDTTAFKKLRVYPDVSLKLYPGIAVPYTMEFKLLDEEKEFSTSLYFQIGRKTTINAPLEALYVPVFKMKKVRSVMVSEEVTIAPAYFWHINKSVGFPTGFITVYVKDDFSYNLRVVKRVIESFEDFEEDSLKHVCSMDSESMEQRHKDIENETELYEENLIKPSLTDELKILSTVSQILDEVLTRALDIFVLKYHYLSLLPKSKQSIPVYFTKSGHIGDHQSCYDFKFFDSETDELISTKTCMILANVLPHPINVDPSFLDMSKSPESHGFCVDYITVSNTHIFVPASVKIKMTNKMRRIFQIHPMETKLAPTSSTKFRVQFCARDFLSRNKSDEMVHFTFKIVVSGDPSVFNRVPPFFYEVIAPCAFEFKKVYKKFTRIYETLDTELRSDERCSYEVSKDIKIKTHKQ